jgi:DNA polymerase III sliding clamp (beta) subunit (PCNA family)
MRSEAANLNSFTINQNITISMKPIELPVNDLKCALAGFAKVAPRRSTLPVLTSLRINRDQMGAITLQVTDLESFATYKLPVSQPGEPVEFLVPIEQLSKAVKGAKDHVALYQEEQDSVILQTKVSRTLIEQKMSVMAPNHWPEVPQLPAPTLEVDQTFRQAFREAMECASVDQSRYVLNAVYLDVEDKKAHYVVATDGRIMFSANSFIFPLKESVMIPTRKFLGWSGWWTEGKAQLAVKPGEKGPKPDQVDKPGWLQFTAGQWTFITKQIEGNYPHWKQVVPKDGFKTTIHIPEEAIKSVLEVIARIPGDYEPNYPITLNASDAGLVILGQNKDQREPACVPIPAATVKGIGGTVCLNRQYLAKALRFGLTEINITDEVTPLLLQAGGKRMVIMPIRQEGSASPSEPSTPPQVPPTQAAQEAAQPEPTPTTETKAEATPAPAMSERTDMTKETNRIAAHEDTTPEPQESPLRKALQQIDTMKDTLRAVVSEFSEVMAALKQAEKDKRTSDKEVEVIREKLRDIQSVRI